MAKQGYLNPCDQAIANHIVLKLFYCFLIVLKLLFHVGYIDHWLGRDIPSPLSIGGQMQGFLTHIFTTVFNSAMNVDTQKNCIEFLLSIIVYFPIH